MILEDHLGDVVRKARLAALATPEDASRAAGMTLAEYGALEETGLLPTPAGLASLAARIGLHPKKLAGIAAGWRPSPADLGAWRELHPIATTQGSNTVNCYLVWDEVTREAALFDTGWDAAPALALIAEHDLALKHLFLTHSHEDHIAGLAALRAKYPTLRIHTNSKSAPPQHRNRANDCVQLGSLRIMNRDTPGHTEDGVIYLVGNWPEDAPHVAMVGDTLFAGSLATGFLSTETLKQSVRGKIFSLPPQTLLCSGHGPLTTVAQERAHNPFFHD